MIITQIKITIQQARQFLLTYQGLLPPRRLQGKNGILQFIRRTGSIQFDPLNKVGRNPDLVLQSRLKNYSSDLLQQLLYRDRRLLDGWDKNMSIYPVKDWPYFHRYREKERRRIEESSKAVIKILPQIRRAIKERGPLSSIDLDHDKKVDWSWAPTRLSRAALESMYSWGELIVHHKIGTRKVYDFSEKYLSSSLLSAADPNTTEEQYYKWHVKRRIGGVGMLWARSGSAWLGISGLKSEERNQAISRLLSDNEIFKVKVRGIDDPFFICTDERSLLDKVLSHDQHRPEAAILAPLDNFLWDRKLINKIFAFDYIWEVYKPVSERKYGYYVLPILFGDRFVARFEPIFDKNKNELIIKNWWWEPEFSLSQQSKSALTECFKAFLNYLGADGIRLNGDEDLKGVSWVNDITWNKK